MTNKKGKRIPKEEKPSDYCRRRQDEELDKGNEKAALEYYELAKQWIEKGM
ncbi:hypothetical protein [Citrobacter phage CVT22]|uniref:Uncharacterized protein n=1 Tax=Citrobacter phage CVT22 TaxID=1622234 RepID=A0A0R6CHJ9_9CAUD|nr:hypothetical protein APL39_gp32 [Citrobacter phage CVT22]AJT60736.1 hypothetical protein [Citrobacter phage CVT22]